jgi:hypothetical protein
MSFILLESGGHAAASADPTGENPSGPPENWLKGHPNYRIVTAPFETLASGR